MASRSRSLGALLALGLVIGGCGSSAPDRFDLTTPESAASAPAPVTDAERRVIRGWSEEMRHGDVKAASKYFSVPSESVGVPPGGASLSSEAQVEEFNDSFPCGAKLLGIERAANRLILADFELTTRPGAQCGKSTGTHATFAFLIDAANHIARLILVEDPGAPMPGGGDLTTS